MIVNINNFLLTSIHNFDNLEYIMIQLLRYFYLLDIDQHKYYHFDININIIQHMFYFGIYNISISINKVLMIYYLFMCDFNNNYNLISINIIIINYYKQQISHIVINIQKCFVAKQSSYCRN